MNAPPGNKHRGIANTHAIHGSIAESDMVQSQPCAFIFQPNVFEMELHAEHALLQYIPSKQMAVTEVEEGREFKILCPCSPFPVLQGSPFALRVAVATLTFNTSVSWMVYPVLII